VLHHPDLISKLHWGPLISSKSPVSKLKSETSQHQPKAFKKSSMNEKEDVKKLFASAHLGFLITNNSF
jgi:hypothetical protein